MKISREAIALDIKDAISYMHEVVLNLQFGFPLTSYCLLDRNIKMRIYVHIF